jgi:hypothetical protein
MCRICKSFAAHFVVIVSFSCDVTAHQANQHRHTGELYAAHEDKTTQKSYYQDDMRI